MLTIVYNVVFRQVLRHIILDNSLHYFAHYACQTNRSVVPWLTPISLLVNRDKLIRTAGGWKQQPRSQPTENLPASSPPASIFPRASPSETYPQRLQAPPGR